jgi:3-dehydroquinate synthase
MQKIRLDLGERSYNIAIDSAQLKDIGKTLERFEFSKRLALVSNPTVFDLYGEIVSRSVRDEGFVLSEVIIPDGEEYKTLQWTEHIYSELLKARLDRKSAVIALGGGVIGDIAGFAASTYMRGIDFIQVPTTLLAQVDSSVGGKTGVNHPLGKNMIGTFWQPRLVWIDLDTLETLPEREFFAGISEIIKYGVIWDEDLFDFLDINRDLILKLDRQALTYVIKRSCEIKSEVVSRDEREAGLRAILNYGHTVGHAIETVTGYRRYLHGEAVAVGMVAEATIALSLGFMDKKELQRIKSLIESYGLASTLPDTADIDGILEAVQMDKKAVSGELKFILPERIGSVKIQGGVSAADLRKALSVK